MTPLEAKQAERNHRSKMWTYYNLPRKLEYMKEWRRKNPLKAVIHSLTTGARNRANKIGMEHDWIALDADRLFQHLSQNMACPCCGVQMTAEVETGAKVTAISLDRVDNDRGYVVGNVAVICRQCNTRKKAMTSQELRMIAAYIDRHLL